MKQLTLNIDDKKFKTFLNFIKTLNYVSIADSKAVALEQQFEVDRRVRLAEEEKMKKRKWEETKNDVFQK